jgi:hypothetical protein
MDTFQLDHRSIFFSGCVPEDTARLVIHAAAISFGPRPQLADNGLVGISDN